MAWLDNNAAQEKPRALDALTMRAASAAVRALFRLMKLFPEKRRIALLSRQSARPLDFRLIEPEIRRRFPNHEIAWACVTESGQMGVGLMLRQMWYAASSRLCFVDGYVPAVCMCAGLHRATCVQMWHALGAIKKFGRQSLDTPAGRSSQIAHALRMHEGYDFVVAGLPGAAHDFAEAMGYPMDRLVVEGLPRVDYLIGRRTLASDPQRLARESDAVRRLASLRAAGKRVILYAPTFRKASHMDKDWLSEEASALQEALTHEDAVVAVVGHPLQPKQDAAPGSDAFSGSDAPVYVRGVSSADVLCVVDAVVTDYSAVAFEAWFSQVPVVFYVPDIEEYRTSPGLNIDPLEQFPDVAFVGIEEVACALVGLGENAARPNAESSFARFMQTYARGVDGNSTSRIVDLLEPFVLRR